MQCKAFWHGLFPYTYGNQLAQETKNTPIAPIIMPPSRTQQEEAYEAHKKTLTPELKAAIDTDEHRQYGFTSSILNLNQLNTYFEGTYSEDRLERITNDLYTIASYSHREDIRQSKIFQACKLINFSSIIKLYEKSKKDLDAFSYADEHPELDAYRETWHWNNVKATLTKYFIQKNTSKKQLIDKQMVDINQHYDKKLAHIKQHISWSEWAFGYSDATKQKIHNSELNRERQAYFVAREWAYQKVAEKLEKTRNVQTLDDICTLYEDIANHKEWKATHLIPAQQIYSYEGALEELNKTITDLERWQYNTTSGKQFLQDDLYPGRAYLQVANKVPDDLSSTFNKYNHTIIELTAYAPRQEE